jgi:hypothetical protein
LFAERNLWQLYRQSSPFYRNAFNRWAVIIVGVILMAFAITDFLGLAQTSTNRLDFSALFSMWAQTGLSYGATILGFLLAGFAVLFAVLRPHTVVALRQITRPGERLHELKLIFVTFVDVFVHYTAFLFCCVLYLIAGGNNGPFDLMGRYLAIVSPWIRPAIMHAAFVIWGLWFLVLVLKLKSFIYNLYQTLLLGMASDAID